MLYMNLQVKEMLFRMVYESCLVVLASVCLCELVILRKKTKNNAPYKFHEMEQTCSQFSANSPRDLSRALNVKGRVPQVSVELNPPNQIQATVTVRRDY